MFVSVCPSVANPFSHKRTYSPLIHVPTLPPTHSTCYTCRLAYANKHSCLPSNPKPASFALWKRRQPREQQTLGWYHGGRRTSSDDILHSPTVIPPSAFDQPSIMKRYHRRRTCSHTSPRRSTTMLTLHDTGFVEYRWWNDGWTVKTVVTWRSSASMIPAPGFDSRLRRGSLSWPSHTSDLRIGTPVATLPGARQCRVSTGTGRPGVSIL